MLLESYGGGRGKPKWAERLAKKYIWLGLYQLASRLNDHVERDELPGITATRKDQLILPSMRQLDPTVPIQSKRKSTDSELFQFGIDRELTPVQVDEFDNWLRSESVPHLRELIRPIDYKGRLMRPLVMDYGIKGGEKNVRLGKCVSRSVDRYPDVSDYKRAIDWSPR